ncbi:MAG: hypothetical protein H8Z69_03175 [Nanohaloarchaea archaeon]|nr:hypothetical protein [Candidatus Nanohaloarchaea archaeon]
MDVSLRRGKCSIDEEEISIDSSIDRYMRNILRSWHGPVWSLILAVYVLPELFLGFNSGVEEALFALLEVSVSFLIFILGMYILRFRQFSRSKKYLIKKEDVNRISSKVALNSETWFVREMFEIHYTEDGKDKSVTIMPLKGEKEKLSEALNRMEYPLED